MRLVDQLNETLANTPLFYLSREPERGLGLERVLENYHIISARRPDFAEQIGEKTHIFIPESKQTALRSAADLLADEQVREYISNKTSNSYLLSTFKPSRKFESLASVPILSPKAMLNEQFEQKISQYNLLKDSVNFPKTILSPLKAVSFADATTQLGEPFFVQFNRGHTGESTIHITSKNEYNALAAKFPHREARLSEAKSGDTYTVIGCVSDKGTFIAGLSRQLTGLHNFTSNPLATVGNDWKIPSSLSSLERDEITKQTSDIGNALHRHNYIGLFGVDFIVQGNDVCVIEVNARQTMSVATYTKFQLAQDITPILAIGYAAHLGLPIDLDVEEYNQQSTQPFDGSQLILRSTHKNNGTLQNDIASGVYRLQSDNSAFSWGDEGPRQKENVIYLDEEKDKPLVFQNAGYSIEDITTAGILITGGEDGSAVSQNEELARLQLKQSVFDTNGKLLHWVEEIARGLREYLVVL